MNLPFRDWSERRSNASEKMRWFLFAWIAGSALRFHGYDHKAIVLDQNAWWNWNRTRFHWTRNSDRVFGNSNPCSNHEPTILWRNMSDYPICLITLTSRWTSISDQTKLG
jgi:hypothetical protein